MSKPLISILMPAYNEEKFIAQAIDSILEQSHHNWELLILDDCSTDGTWQIIDGYHDVRIHKFRNETNQKYQACCNRLFNEASGTYLTFLDADDTCPTDRLEKYLVALTEATADYLTTDHKKRYENDGESVNHHIPVDHERLATDLDYYPTICCATVFAKTDLVRESGGYSMVFAGFGADDYHWVWRLSRLGKGIHLNEVLYTYRIHDHQMRNEVSTEHFVCHDLDRAIRKKLVEEGVDLCLADNHDQADQLKMELLAPYRSDPAKLFREQSIQELNHGKWSAAISVLTHAISTSPFNLKNWGRFFYVLYVMTRRTLSGNARP